MKGLLDFIRQESGKLKKGQCVLGHTEVLESLLGKYKQIQGRHSPVGQAVPDNQKSHGTMGPIGGRITRTSQQESRPNNMVAPIVSGTA